MKRLPRLPRSRQPVASEPQVVRSGAEGAPEPAADTSASGGGEYDPTAQLGLF